MNKECEAKMCMNKFVQSFPVGVDSFSLFQVLGISFDAETPYSKHTRREGLGTVTGHFERDLVDDVLSESMSSLPISPSLESSMWRTFPSLRGSYLFSAGHIIFIFDLRFDFALLLQVSFITTTSVLIIRPLLSKVGQKFPELFNYLLKRSWMFISTLSFAEIPFARLSSIIYSLSPGRVPRAA